MLSYSTTVGWRAGPGCLTDLCSSVKCSPDPQCLFLTRSLLGFGELRDFSEFP